MCTCICMHVHMYNTMSCRSISHAHAYILGACTCACAECVASDGGFKTKAEVRAHRSGQAEVRASRLALNRYTMVSLPPPFPAHLASPCSLPAHLPCRFPSIPRASGASCVVC